VRSYGTLPLKWKILLPFVLLTVLWAASAIFLLTKNTADRARARINSNLQSQILNAGNAFADLVASHIELERSVSNTEGVAEALLATDEVALARLIVPLLTSSRAEGLSLTGPDGKEVVGFWRDRGSIELLEQGFGIPSTHLVDLAQIPLSATDEAIFMTPAVKGRLMVAGGPVVRGETTVGSVAVASRATRLVEHLSDSGAGRMAIYSKEGEFLAATPNVPQLGESIIITAGDKVRTRSADEEILVGSLTGRDQVLARAAVFQKWSGVVDEVRRTILGLSLLGFLATIAVAGVGMILARALTAPLERMAATARGIASGNLSSRAAVRGGDEIGTLASAFNTMAEQLQTSYEDLEQRVAERTQELEQVAKELEVMGSNKSDFIASLAHELRTPLNAILGYSELLADPSFGAMKPAEVRKHARAINQSGHYLMQLINDVLDLSKIEAGKLDLDVQTVQVKSTIREVMNLIDPMATSKHIRLRSRTASAPDFIQADPRRLRQILINLLSNAVKFTPEEGSVVVDASRDGRYLLISVIDTGVGIPPEDRERIFDQFHQAGGSYTRNQEGTGLGLTLTKQLVELHGGTIEVESEVGKGSTFRFRIPVGATSARSRRAS
jgi:signal transduction histidine kinase